MGGMQRISAGMQGRGWECWESVWECRESGRKCEKCRESGWQCSRNDIE